MKASQILSAIMARLQWYRLGAQLGVADRQRASLWISLCMRQKPFSVGLKAPLGGGKKVRVSYLLGHLHWSQSDRPKMVRRVF